MARFLKSLLTCASTSRTYTRFEATALGGFAPLVGNVLSQFRLSHSWIRSSQNEKAV